MRSPCQQRISAAAGSRSVKVRNQCGTTERYPDQWPRCPAAARARFISVSASSPLIPNAFSIDRTSPSFTPTAPDSILLTLPWVQPRTSATCCCVIPAAFRACRSSFPSCFRREVTVLAIALHSRTTTKQRRRPGRRHARTLSNPPRLVLNLAKFDDDIAQRSRKRRRTPVPCGVTRLDQQIGRHSTNRVAAFGGIVGGVIDRSPAAATVQPLAEGAYGYVQPDGSWYINNCGFVAAGDHTVLIDTCSTERRTRALLGAVSATTSTPVTTLVNTHHHGDHTNGNYLVAGATAIGHRKTRELLVAEGIQTYEGIFTGSDWGELRVRPPEVVFEDRLTVYAGDVEIQLIHPGHAAHTTNDVLVWLPARRVLYAGDLVF